MTKEKNAWTHRLTGKLVHIRTDTAENRQEITIVFEGAQMEEALNMQYLFGARVLLSLSKLEKI